MSNLPNTYRHCEHPDCTQPASSRTGTAHEGHWTGHPTLTCLTHQPWARQRPMYSGQPVYTGVLDRRV